MGLRWSRVGSTPYYLNYEKSFDKIASKEALIEARVAKRRQRMQNYTMRSTLVCGAWFAAAAMWWGYAGRYIIEPYSRQWFISVGISLGGFLLLLLLAVLLRKLLGLLEEHDKVYLKRLGESRKKMLKELKDSTNFEKTMALLRKYDPEAQPRPSPTPRGGPRQGNGTPHGQPGMPPGGAGPLMANPNQVVPGGTPASQLLMRTGTAAAAAAMGAGKALFPMFDSLAQNVIGDNPELVQELMRARQEADALRQENQALRKHLAHLAPDGLPALPPPPGQPLLLGPPPALAGPPSLDTLPDNGPWQQGGTGLQLPAPGESGAGASAAPPPLRLLQEVELEQEEADGTADVSSSMSRAAMAAAAEVAAARQQQVGGGVEAAGARQPAGLVGGDSPSAVEDVSQRGVGRQKGGGGSSGGAKGGRRKGGR